METHNIFTDDLIEDILLRLPVRHLLRLRCVSKSWCSLIDSTKFIEKHHQIQSAISREEGDAPLLLDSHKLYYDESEFYLLSKKLGDNILCLTSDIDRDRVPNDDPNHFVGLCCMGVVNGVVGLCWGEDCLGLWNPSTKDFIVVPPPRSNDFQEDFHFGVDILGLGFDPKSSDFKIVRSIYISEYEYVCEMYSLSANSWTSLELAASRETGLYVNFPRTDVYYNGVHYWTAAEHDELDYDPPPPRYVILSFDFNTKVFKFFDPPPVVIMSANNMDNFDWIVGQYVERLALIFHQNSGEALYSFDIWVASEFDIGRDSGMSLSWQHLFTIQPCSGVCPQAFVAFRMDGDVLLDTYTSKKCKLYNPSTRTFKTLGLSFNCGYKYVESLFPLSKRQIESYMLKKRKRMQVLKRFAIKYDEAEEDVAYSRPTASRKHKCSCCNELGSIKEQLEEIKKVVVCIAGMLTDNLNPPSQPPPHPNDEIYDNA